VSFLVIRAGAQAGASGRTSIVPIRQTVLSDGQIRYSVPVSVGGSKLEAMLDTGSVGLRVLERAILGAAYVSTGPTSTYHYGSGVRFHGVIAEAALTIGGAGGASPIQVIDSVDCRADAPRCPASRVSADEYRIGGDGLRREGFAAILGVNMGKPYAMNPLAHIGARSWTVILPKRGESVSGELIINPDEHDVAGYTLFQTDEILRNLPEAGGFHDAISGCLSELDSARRICGPTLLDTGAPGLHIISPRPAELSGWRPGTRVELSFATNRDAPLRTGFVVDSDRSSKLTSAMRMQPRTWIMAGSLPYFAFSVFYDLESGMVGLKPR